MTWAYADNTEPPEARDTPNSGVRSSIWNSLLLWRGSYAAELGIVGFFVLPPRRPRSLCDPYRRQQRGFWRHRLTSSASRAVALPVNAGVSRSRPLGGSSSTPPVCALGDVQRARS